jgi:hypothetical protein
MISEKNREISPNGHAAGDSGIARTRNGDDHREMFMNQIRGGLTATITPS